MRVRKGLAFQPKAVVFASASLTTLALVATVWDSTPSVLPGGLSLGAGNLAAAFSANANPAVSKAGSPGHLTLPTAFLPQHTMAETHTLPTDLPGVVLDQRVRLHLAPTGPVTPTGAEHFVQAADVLQQLSQGVDEARLSVALADLGVQAEAMAEHLRKAARLRFEGQPGADFTHLKVRADMLVHLSELNANALQVMDLNQNGERLDTGSHVPSQSTFEPGSSLSGFLASAQQLERLPAARHYPQTLKLVRQQAQHLKTLASHLALRWETRFRCEGRVFSTCQGNTLGMRIYVHQSLPASQTALLTDDGVRRQVGLLAQAH